MYITEYFFPRSALALGSFSFMLVILPVFVIIHRLFPLRFRAGILLVLSAVYCLFARPESLGIMAALIILDYCAVRLMKKYDANQNARRLLMWLSVGKGIAAVCACGIYARTSASPPLFGVIVCALSGMSAVVDIYKRECEYEPDFIKFSLYCLFFPRLYAGPLMGFADFTERISTPPKWQDAPLGAAKFIMGAVKLNVLGQGLSALYIRISTLPPESATVLSSWMLVIVFAMAVYFILSGFSDMATGIGGIFGIKLPQNFYYPYQSRGVGDFFERFNMTLGGYINKYVYKNLGGDTKGIAIDFINIAITCALTGLWFGFYANRLLWGLFLSLFVFTGKYLFLRASIEMPTLIRRFLTLCVVLASFAILISGSLSESVDILKNMSGFSAGVPFADNAIKYALSSNWLLLAVSCFFCTNVFDIIMNWLKKATPRFFGVLYSCIAVLLLGIYVSLSL